jgi:hypothetical protein
MTFKKFQEFIVRRGFILELGEDFDGLTSCETMVSYNLIAYYGSSNSVQRTFMGSFRSMKSRDPA